MKKTEPLTCLINTCRLVNYSLNLDDILRGVTKMSKEVLRAEAGSLMLLDESGKKLNFAIALGKKSSKLKKSFSLKLGQGIAGWVAEKGTSVVVPDVRKDKRFYKKPDKTIDFKTHSILAVPLRVQNNIIGVLEVINPIDKPSFSGNDIPMFEAFACQVAVAIENSRMHKKMLEQQKTEQELTIANKIQQNILPHKSLEHDNISITAEYKSAKQIGGDFFDIIELEDRTIVAIGDVSGKGIPAALYMVRLLTELRSFASSHRDISLLAHKLNDALLQRSTLGMFATAIILCIDKVSKKIYIVNAGHPNPILIKKSGTLMLKTSKGLPMGIIAGKPYLLTEIELKNKTNILLYTDGILEARSKKRKEFGIKKLLTESKKIYNSKDPLEQLFSAVTEFSKGTAQHDDLTAVLIKIR